MQFFEYGKPDGTPLVFLLGTPHTGDSVAELSALASEHGIRLICPTRSWYLDSAVEPSFESCTGSVLAYLDQGGAGPAAVMGGSGGGPFALHLATSRPEQFKACYLLASMGDPKSSARRWHRRTRRHCCSCSTPAVTSSLSRNSANGESRPSWPTGSGPTFRCCWVAGPPSTSTARCACSSTTGKKMTMPRWKVSGLSQPNSATRNCGCRLMHPTSALRTTRNSPSSAPFSRKWPSNYWPWPNNSSKLTPRHGAA